MYLKLRSLILSEYYISKVNWLPSCTVTGLSIEEKCGVVARADILEASANFQVRSAFMNCKILLIS